MSAPLLNLQPRFADLVPDRQLHIDNLREGIARGVFDGLDDLGRWELGRAVADLLLNGHERTRL